MIRRLLQISSIAVAIALLGATPAGGVMKSTKLPDGTCATTGGGRIVAIPGFPGERIDRRLLTDIRWLQKRYPIFITDGYSADPVHAANGEHPLGLALDIVPNKEIGGIWAQVTALALFAEPIQDEPVAPFRWVGYDGDAGHGRGHHLHLSWGHSVVGRTGRLARTVYTIRCPRPATPPIAPGGTTPVAPTEPAPPPPPPTGAGPAGASGGVGAHAVKSTGGVSAPGALAHGKVVTETDGVGISDL